MMDGIRSPCINYIILLHLYQFNQNNPVNSNRNSLIEILLDLLTYIY